MRGLKDFKMMSEAGWRPEKSKGYTMMNGVHAVKLANLCGFYAHKKQDTY